MSETKEDGGHAFPRVTGFRSNDQSHQYKHSTVMSSEGMSLRDYFAGQALGEMGTDRYGWTMEPEKIATRCYALADAMIKARKS